MKAKKYGFIPTTRKNATVIQAPAPAPLKVPVNPARPIKAPSPPPQQAPAAPVRINVPVPQREKVTER